MAEGFDTSTVVQGLLQHIQGALKTATAGVAEEMSAMARPDNVDAEQAKVLAAKSGVELRNLRATFPNDAKLNEALAPYEHRADFRSMIGEEPNLLRAMGIAGGLATAVVPGYQAAKLLGVANVVSNQQKVEGDTDPTTPASLSQLLQGYIGIGEGVADRTKQIFK